LKPQVLCEKFIKREKESSTVIKKGLAIPHIIVEGKNIFKVLLIRARGGIVFPQDEVAHTVFVLVGSAGDRVLHLKVLAAIAQVVQNPEFDKKWLEARSEDELRNIILLAERRRG
jgi:mannitol/fructose-specific phosphotransferase system IIA component (Ntr-type)